MTQHPIQHRKLWLEQLIKENDFRFGAELGVHEGVTHFYLMDVFPDLRMIGVDQYQGIQLKYWAAVDLKLKDYIGRSTFYRMTTAEAARRVKDESLDFVFIDADHSYNSVLADIKNWAPKVKPGGYISGHDINMSSVKRAVKETVGNYNTAWDDVWYIKK